MEKIEELLDEVNIILINFKAPDLQRQALQKKIETDIVRLRISIKKLTNTKINRSKGITRFPVVKKEEPVIIDDLEDIKIEVEDERLI
jgi:hypothetical protein